MTAIAMSPVNLFTQRLPHSAPGTVLHRASASGEDVIRSSSMTNEQISEHSLQPGTRDPEELAAALHDGHPSVVEGIYDAYGGLVYTIALRFLGSPERAEELVQEVFLAMWERRSSFDPERGSLKTWLCTIVRSRALDLLRADRRRPRQAYSLDAAYENRQAAELPDTSHVSDPAAVVETRAVLRALDILPDDQRETIELMYLAGLSQSELSTVLGIPLGTVKGRVRLAFAKLRSHLGIQLEVES